MFDLVGDFPDDGTVFGRTLGESAQDVGQHAFPSEELDPELFEGGEIGRGIDGLQGTGPDFLKFLFHSPAILMWLVFE